MAQKAQVTKGKKKTDKLDFIKIKRFCVLKDTIKKEMGENICLSHI